MRVALFVHCFYPDHFYGTETYTLQVARQLQRMGHDPLVVSAVFQGETRREGVVTHYSYEGIPVYCIDKNFVSHTRVKETYYQEAMRDVLRGALAEIKPDLVHVTHLMNHTAVLLEVAQELGVPTVGTLTDFFGFCYNNKLEAADGSLCRGPNASRSNCIACCLKAGSKGMARFITRYSTPVAHGLSFLPKVPVIGRGSVGGRVLDLQQRPDILQACYRHYRAVITPTRFLREAYVTNGLDVPCFDIQFGVDIARESKPRRSAGRPVALGFIGQIAPHKGTDLLVKAFTLLPRGGATLEIFGPEDQDPEFTAGLKSVAAGHSIYFRGTFPNQRMAEILAGLDVLVVPSRWYENSPLVLLNALATHTPVIVSDVAGLTDFVDEGRSGFRFERGNVRELERVLRKFVDDPQLAARMSHSTEYVRTSRTMVEETQSVYSFARSAA